MPAWREEEHPNETTAPNERGGTNTNVTERDASGFVVRTQSQQISASGHVDYSRWDYRTGYNYWSATLTPKVETTNKKEGAEKREAR